ncbi:hypothetical protein LINPERPRIM_LOCUS32592 [Linum perenne]
MKLSRNGGISGKGKVEEAESSGVTEEHGLPVCNQSPSHSSDSVKGSTKRAGDECTTTETKKRNLVRFKLRVPKPEEEPVRIDHPCLPSSSAKVVDRVADGDAASTSAANLTKKEDEIVSNVGRNNSRNGTKKKLSINEVYNSISNAWTLEGFESESEDLDWLLPSKKPVGRVDVIKDSCNASASSTTWPRAQHMPGLEFYALPYTIPF